MTKCSWRNISGRNVSDYLQGDPDNLLDWTAGIQQKGHIGSGDLLSGIADAAEFSDRSSREKERRSSVSDLYIYIYILAPRG